MFSFIVPAYNEEAELPETLAAIRRAADLSAQPYEIIVVDDASTDRTRLIAEEAEVRVLSGNHRQIAAARNAGARAARGDVLFFVDADTRISAAHVGGALHALEFGCAGGSARVQVDGRIPIWAQISLALFSFLYFSANLGVGAFLFTRRETFEAVGGFDEQYFAGEETCFSIALKRQGRFVILPEPILTSGRKVRMHSASHLLAQFCFIVFGGKRSLRGREKLALWYDGKRESSAA